MAFTGISSQGNNSQRPLDGLRLKPLGNLGLPGPESLDVGARDDMRPVKALGSHAGLDRLTIAQGFLKPLVGLLLHQLRFLENFVGFEDELCRRLQAVVAWHRLAGLQVLLLEDGVDQGLALARRSERALAAALVGGRQPVWRGSVLNETPGP